MACDSLTPSPGSDPPDYSEVVSFEESPLYQAVVNLDVIELRHYLDLDYDVHETGKFGQTLLHALLYSLSSQAPNDPIWTSQARLKIVYILSNAGIDLNAKDQSQQTALQYAAQCGDAELCEVLLQCGSDMFVPEENGLTLYENVIISGDNANLSAFHKTKSLTKVFEKYQPGLWQAVATENLTEVRKMINMWCKTDLIQNHKTLRELALDTGNEGIISLVSAVIPSMRLVHQVLAGDVKGVKKLFNSDLRPKIHINLKNLGHHSAPILYFVIQERNIEMLKEFKRQGSSIVTHMRDEEDCDMPVIFSALQPDMPAQIIAELLPESRHVRLLEQLTYKGKNILQVALERNVAVDAVDAILQRGGARLVCIRNVNNHTARDWAVLNNRHYYTELIDKHVARWILRSEEYPGQRETLALWGYEHTANIAYQWMQANSIAVQDIPLDALQYLEGLDMYQEQIADLAYAAEDNNVTEFQEKMCYVGNGPFARDLWWDGRPRGDGLPLLHRAVLHNHIEIVACILRLWENHNGSDSVDGLVDQTRRTALHYACAMQSSNKAANLLRQYGCSEHMLDKDSHEPLDFSEVQGTATLNSLLDRVRNKQYHLPEPNPWDATLLAELRQLRAMCVTTVSYPTHTCEHRHSFSAFGQHEPSARAQTLPGANKRYSGNQSKAVSLYHSQSQTLTQKKTKKENLCSPKRRRNLNVSHARLTRLEHRDTACAGSRETVHLLKEQRSSTNRRATLAEQEQLDSDDEGQQSRDEANQLSPLMSDGDVSMATADHTNLNDSQGWEEEEDLLPSKHVSEQRNCIIL